LNYLHGELYVTYLLEIQVIIEAIPAANTIANCQFYGWCTKVVGTHARSPVKT